MVYPAAFKLPAIRNQRHSWIERHLPLPILNGLPVGGRSGSYNWGISRMGHGIRRLGCLCASHRRTGSSAAAHSQQRRGTWLPTRSANPDRWAYLLAHKPPLETPPPPHSRARFCPVRSDPTACPPLPPSPPPLRMPPR